MQKHLINKSQALERINSFALDGLFVPVLTTEMDISFPQILK
jgi:hypothetical protein